MNYKTSMNQFAKMLKNLSNFIDKAQKYADTKSFDSNVFLNCRLAPDQFPFVRQVQISCDTAKFCAALLTGKEAPAHPDNEQSLSELKTRIQTVLTYLQSFSEQDFKDSPERKIYRPRWEGRYTTGEEFLFQHATPNFYFHVTTAYSILRHNGVDLGKKDFLGELPLKS